MTFNYTKDGSRLPLMAPSSPCVLSPLESRFQCVKQALHTAVPERLLSREAERASIRSFLEEKVLQRLPGSLYISGAPGTGKTACLNCVLQEMKVLLTEVIFDCVDL